MRDFVLPVGLLGLVVALSIIGTLAAQPLLLVAAMCVALPTASFAMGYSAHRWKSHYRIVSVDRPLNRQRQGQEVLS
jgi:hypothetical protein